MRKKLIGVLVVLIVLVLAVPVLNLILGGPENRLVDVTLKDPVATRVVHTVSAKCVHCHTTEPHRPFYGKLPVVKSLIDRDIEEGTVHVNYLEEFLGGPDYEVSEVALAKTEYAVRNGLMPPAQYLLVHWNHALSDEERADLMEWVAGVRSASYSDPRLPEDLRKSTIRPLMPAENIDPRKASLGELLFHDTRLSGDGTVSCASCHDLDTGGCDRRQFSTGVGGAVGGINAPTVFNSGLFLAQFWDGRAADLQEQAAGPVTNPIEMAADWDEVISELNRDRKLRKAFRKVYREGISKETVTDAIAEFERTLVTTDSPFDLYLAGNDEAIPEEAKMGYERYLAHACDTCHTGPAMGGQSYEKMGIEHDYMADRGLGTDADLGRFHVTGEERDRHRFKVPTLRNIAATYPYLHDGSVDDLREVVILMARYQKGSEIPEADADLIVAFLETLSGEYGGEAVR